MDFNYSNTFDYLSLCHIEMFSVLLSIIFHFIILIDNSNLSNLLKKMRYFSYAESILKAKKINLIKNIKLF